MMLRCAFVLLAACAASPAPAPARATRQIEVPPHREPQRGIGATRCDDAFASACGQPTEECRLAIDRIAIGCAPRVQELLPPGYGPRELMEVGELMSRCTIVQYVVERQAAGFTCGAPPPDPEMLELCAICAEGPTQVMKPSGG